MDDVKTVRTKEMIPVKLSNQDIGRMAKKIGEFDTARLVAMDEYRGHKKLYDIRMNELKDKVAPLMKALREGVEEREVECDKVLFFNNKTVRFLDPKTKAIIFERPMNKEELQSEMFQDVPEPPKETCSTKTCIACGVEWFGGDNKAICWNCKKLDSYRFSNDNDFHMNNHKTAARGSKEK
jgi:hypothetical protein